MTPIQSSDTHPIVAIRSRKRIIVLSRTARIVTQKSISFGECRCGRIEPKAACIAEALNADGTILCINHFTVLRIENPAFLGIQLIGGGFSILRDC